jgi:flagellar assembly protein FliH
MSGTNRFQPYQFQELTQEVAPAPAQDSQAYQEPQFKRQANSTEVDSIHRRKDAFHLDQNVASHLGIEERMRRADEDRVSKEIERRWEQTAEKAEVAGYTKGLEEGKAEAYKAEMPRIRERIEKLDNLLQQIDRFRDRIFVANEVFLMDIIAEAVGIIALKEIELDKDYVARLVITLLHQLGTKDDVKIFLSEGDFANVEVLRQVLEKEFGKLTNTTIDFSPEIPLGGCKIETRFGVVDATVASQIENVKKALKN